MIHIFIQSLTKLRMIEYDQEMSICDGDERRLYRRFVESGTKTLKKENKSSEMTIAHLR